MVACQPQDSQCCQESNEACQAIEETMVEQFIELISRSFDIAIEWPQNCRCWKFSIIVRFMKDTHWSFTTFIDACLELPTTRVHPSRSPGLLQCNVFIT